MKDDVENNKWFQGTHKQITHIQKNNDEENYGNDDAPVASDADVSVASAMSSRSA